MLPFARWFAVLLLLAVPVGGQIVARQGDPTEAPIQEFKSPMVLEVPLKDFRELAPGTGRDFSKEVQKYYCDDLAVSQLLISRKEGKVSEVRFDVRGAVTVRPSYDRLAIVRFDVLKGEERFAMAQVPEINAEEGKTRVFSTTLRLDAEAFEKAFVGESPMLRITVTVLGNR